MANETTISPTTEAKGDSLVVLADKRHKKRAVQC